ncbi:hypothetical protein [Streptomyces sp. NPDC002205]|uniref:hypothetical protein n=1 Tax=Streptomyces sp. NPDC002205 TaxID=3154411 RepID=UPI00331A65B1
MAKNSVPVSALEDAATVRVALDALGLKVDGKPAAPRTARRKRACLSDVLGLAVEERYFTTPVNPLTTVKWVAPKSAEEVDPDSVANPRQARSLLKGVRKQGPRGAHLEAFHTIAVLFRVYAKVLAQTQERANHRIDAAMREWNEPE